MKGAWPVTILGGVVALGTILAVAHLRSETPPLQDQQLTFPLAHPPTTAADAREIQSELMAKVHPGMSKADVVRTLGTSHSLVPRTRYPGWYYSETWGYTLYKVLWKKSDPRDPGEGWVELDIGFSDAGVVTESLIVKPIKKTYVH